MPAKTGCGGHFGTEGGEVHHDPAGVAASHAACVVWEVGVVSRKVGGVRVKVGGVFAEVGMAGGGGHRTRTALGSVTDVLQGVCGWWAVVVAAGRGGLGVTQPFLHFDRLCLLLAQGTLLGGSGGMSGDRRERREGVRGWREGRKGEGGGRE